MSSRFVLTIERLEDRTLFAIGIGTTAGLSPPGPTPGVHAAIMPRAAADPAPVGEPNGEAPEIYPPGVSDSPRADASDAPDPDGDNYPLPPANGPAQHGGVAQPPVFTLFLPMRDVPAAEAVVGDRPPLMALPVAATAPL